MHKTPRYGTAASPVVWVLALVILTPALRSADGKALAQEVPFNSAFDPMSSENEDIFDDFGGTHVIVAPELDRSIVGETSAAVLIGTRIPGPPPSPTGPRIVVVNSLVFSSMPPTGGMGILAAVQSANSDGVATRIVFDARVFAAGAGPLLTESALALLEDHDEIDGSGAVVIMQPIVGRANHEYGIGLVGQQQLVKSITLAGFSLAGVVVGGSAADATLEDVTVRDTGAHGLLVMDGGNATIRNSIVTGSGDDGIRVENASATVSGCQISGSGDHGVSVVDGDLRLEGSTLMGNAGFGLYFGGENPGTPTFPSFDIVWTCNATSLGDNDFDPENTLTWFIDPGVQPNADTLITPGGLEPNSLDLSQFVDFFLPFTGGSSTKINQPYHGDFSHKCAVAIDFSLPNGPDVTPIRASAQGRVFRTLNFQDGPRASGGGNSVWVDHGHGIVALYTHLALDSIQVVPGQMVARHAILGMGESSGNSTGPHLHQEFRKPRKARLWPEKFPGVDGACDDPDVPWAVSLVDVPEVDGVPVSGETYTSLNGPEAEPPPFEDSHFAKDLFRDHDGTNIFDDPVIELTRRVPMVYYQTGVPYWFEGNAPAGAVVVRLFMKDYVTREIIKTIDGLVDPNGRFKIGLNLCDFKEGPYLIALDAAHQVNPGSWQFDVYWRDWYPIIFVDGSGVTETPPYFGGGVLCEEPDPDADDDGDTIPNKNDFWFDIEVNSADWDDENSGETDLIEALSKANTDCRRTLIKFDPSVFPQILTSTIFFERDMKFGNDGDLLTGAGAGVIFRPLDADTSRAFTLTGTTGARIENIDFRDWDDQSVLSVSYRSKLWTNNVDIVKDKNGTGRAFSVGWKGIVNFANGNIFGNPDSSPILVGREGRLTLSNVDIFRGLNGIFMDDFATATLNNVQIALVDSQTVDVSEFGKLVARNSKFQGDVDAANIFATFGTDVTLCDSEILIGFNGITLIGDAFARATGLNIHQIAHQGVFMDVSANLTLHDSEIHDVERGFWVVDDARLKVCDDTITAINPGEVFFDDNRVFDWSIESHFFSSNANYIGGFCEQITCGGDGDGDGNGVLTIDDWRSFEDCMTGPNGVLVLQPPTDACLFSMDTDGNAAIDLKDFVLGLQRNFGRTAR